MSWGVRLFFLCLIVADTALALLPDNHVGSIDLGAAAFVAGLWFAAEVQS